MAMYNNRFIRKMLHFKQQSIHILAKIVFSSRMLAQLKTFSANKAGIKVF